MLRPNQELFQTAPSKFKIVNAIGQASLTTDTCRSIPGPIVFGGNIVKIYSNIPVHEAYSSLSGKTIFARRESLFIYR